MVKRIVAALVVSVLVGGWVSAQEEKPTVTFGGLLYGNINLVQSGNFYGDTKLDDPITGSMAYRFVGRTTYNYGRIHANISQETRAGNLYAMIRLVQNGGQFGSARVGANIYMEGHLAWRPDPMFTVMYGHELRSLMGSGAMDRYWLHDSILDMTMHADATGAANVRSAYIGDGFYNGLGFAIVPIPSKLYIHLGLPYNNGTPDYDRELEEIFRRVNARAYYNLEAGRIGLGFVGGGTNKGSTADATKWKLDTGTETQVSPGSLYLFYQNTMVDNLSLRLGARYQLPLTFKFTPETTDPTKNNGKEYSATGAGVMLTSLTGNYSLENWGISMGGTYHVWLGGEENKNVKSTSELGKPYADSRASRRGGDDEEKAERWASRFSIELAPWYDVTSNFTVSLAGAFGMSFAGADYKNKAGKAVAPQVYWGVNPVGTYSLGNAYFQVGVRLYGTAGSLDDNGVRENAPLNWNVPIMYYFSF